MAASRPAFPCGVHRRPSRRDRGTYRDEMRYRFELTGFTVLVEHSDLKDIAGVAGAEQRWVVA